MASEDPSLFDQLVEDTDNGPEPGQPDPDQNADWRPPPADTASSS